MEGARTTVKATGEATGGGLAVIEDLASRGDATPLHRHPADDETFYILEGSVTFWLGEDEPVDAPAGAFVHIAAGVPHAFRVATETARYLIVTTARHGDFYLAISDRADDGSAPPRGELDMVRLEEACDRFGVEILGPPPG
jgi:quercetin dioxygenase-like cupin family protein